MADNVANLAEAISLALRLSPVDRLKLVERIVSSVETEVSIDQKVPVSTTSGHWGAEVIALLKQLDLTDWEQMDIPDAGEWVHQLRRQESEQSERYWKSDE